MSELYQMPGLFLTVLCHAIVIYYMAEHRYARKRFVFYSFIYIVCFVSLGGYGYVTGEISGMAGYYVAIVLRSIVLLLVLALYKKYAVTVFRSLTDSGKR